MQYFYQDKNLDFLKEKIKDIKIALFKTELNPELQLPNNIIQTLKVEDDGTIWFFTTESMLKILTGRFMPISVIKKKAAVAGCSSVERQRLLRMIIKVCFLFAIIQKEVMGTLF